MKSQEEILKLERLNVLFKGFDGGAGQIYLAGAKNPLNVVWSFGGGWEHVSVSLRKRTPTWEEMCKVKEMFWNDDETVIQYHPKKSEYVNKCETCLHLWRKCGQDFETPPKIFV